jgi:hypothetical protein
VSGVSALLRPSYAHEEIVSKSSYLRDVVADMPVFRDRGRPLPMRPIGRCSKATTESISSSPAREPGSVPLFFATMAPIGSIELYFDETVPAGQIEIDGILIPIEKLKTAAEISYIKTISADKDEGEECATCGHHRVFHRIGTGNGVPIGKPFCDDRYSSECNCTGFVNP